MRWRSSRLEDIGAVRSVGSKGDSYDNAAAESVNSLYKEAYSKLPVKMIMQVRDLR